MAISYHGIIFCFYEEQEFSIDLKVSDYGRVHTIMPNATTDSTSVETRGVTKCAFTSRVVHIIAKALAVKLEPSILFAPPTTLNSAFLDGVSRTNVVLHDTEKFTHREGTIPVVAVAAQVSARFDSIHTVSPRSATNALPMCTVKVATRGRACATNSVVEVPAEAVVVILKTGVWKISVGTFRDATCNRVACTHHLRESASCRIHVAANVRLL